ncbi:hypothetical protein ABNG02_14120 [Halorubrum ejinorense]|uniref:Uncharacterized protein n=1 Tax=Halorubrum ejinorense TaxID=425309 RepID=A0AAV3SQJ7_9EURY
MEELSVRLSGPDGVVATERRVERQNVRDEAYVCQGFQQPCELVIPSFDTLNVTHERWGLSSSMLSDRPAFFGVDMSRTTSRHAASSSFAV